MSGSPVEQVIAGAREGASRPLASMRRRQIREAAIQAVITLVALTGIAAVVLIFVFVAREALPIFTSPEVREETDLARMFLPQVWREGRPAFFSWQPVSNVPKYSMVPLFVGTLKVTVSFIIPTLPSGSAMASVKSACHLPAGDERK